MRLLLPVDPAAACSIIAAPASGPLLAEREAKMAKKGSTETKERAREEVFELALGDIKIHPGHERVPDMGADDYPALLQSVKKNGVQVPIELLSEEDAEKRGEKENAGTVLDGRQRVRAAEECGLKTVPAVYARLPEDMDTTEYIFRKAVERRHLNKSQRAIMAVDLKRHFEQGQGFRSDLLQEKFPEVGEGQSRDQAGAILGVSGRYITTAERLLEESPELAEKVRSGEITLNQAVQQLNKEKGKAETKTSYDNAFTAFKRFLSTWKKLRPSKARLPKEEYDDIKALIEQLEEKLAKLPRRMQRQKPKKQEKKATEG